MFNFRFGPNKMPEAKYLVIERLYSMLDSKLFREYSLRKLEKQERATKEASQKLKNQLKTALEQKPAMVNPNENKPKLSLKRLNPSGDSDA